jgi:transporter family-2 protein
LNFDIDCLFFTFSPLFDLGALHLIKQSNNGKDNRDCNCTFSRCIYPNAGGLDGLLGKEIKSPIHASLISFIIGTVAIALYVVLTRQTVSLEGVKNVPWHVWFAGVLGAFSISVIILTMPKLGPGLTMGLVVAGQMLISVGLKHSIYW